MHLLLTRPRSDDDPLPGLLQASGHTVTVEPLLDIVLAPPADLVPQDVQAILVTSSNALRAVRGHAQLDYIRAVPLFAVGAGTARLARDLGFDDVHPGDGALSDLLPHLLGSLVPGDGSVLYLRGRDIAFDIAAPLTHAGHRIAERIVYQAVAKTALQPDVLSGLANTSYHGVVLLSPRTAAVYASLTLAAGLSAATAQLRHYCLSDRVAATLTDQMPVPVCVPQRPTLQEFLALIDLDATHFPPKGTTP
jgi:uroporphyrinogen-III synthase